MHNHFTIQDLKQIYIKEKKSSAEIAKIFNCSASKINYWLSKYKIPKRDISEAIYVKRNPDGDPFSVREPKNIEEAKLWGFGLGIYWGEGNKANKNTVRVGNSDPVLLRVFIEFLVKFFCIKREDLRFHIHLFDDMNIHKTIRFWAKELDIKKQQFYKPMISKSGSLGTYRQKSIYGVLTVYYGNSKLKKILMDNLKYKPT